MNNGGRLATSSLQLLMHPTCSSRRLCSFFHCRKSTRLSNFFSWCLSCRMLLSLLQQEPAAMRLASSLRTCKTTEHLCACKFAFIHMRLRLCRAFAPSCASSCPGVAENFTESSPCCAMGCSSQLCRGSQCHHTLVVGRHSGRGGCVLCGDDQVRWMGTVSSAHARHTCAVGSFLCSVCILYTALNSISQLDACSPP
jgi:hypothetical protein